MIKVFESKAFVLALLTLVAGVAGYEGFNIPITTIMGLLTPLMIAIGAAGWSDAVNLKARMALEHEVKMKALSEGHATYAEVLSGKVPVARTGNAQAGFAKTGLMIAIFTIMGTIALGTSLTAMNQGCATVQPIIADVIQCAQAEATVVSSGYSILQIVAEVVGALRSGDVVTEVGKLISKYGGDIVACAMDNYPEPAPAMAGSGMKLEPPPPDVVNKHAMLAKFFSGKKIDHTPPKK